MPPNKKPSRSAGESKTFHRGEIALRYMGRELHEHVIGAAEAEVERLYVEYWKGHHTAFPRARGGWRRVARIYCAPPPARERDFYETRDAFVKALRAVQADRPVWSSLVHECPDLAKVKLHDFVPEPPTDAQAATLTWRIERLNRHWGPTWGRDDEAPTNRDLALQIILSGWICDGWRGQMRVAAAIAKVVDAVRTHRREHDWDVPSTEVRH